MSKSPIGTGSGIFSLFFREAGLFSEQAWQWANERASETQKYVEERARETQKYVEERVRETGGYVESRARETGVYIDGRTREGQQFLEEQARQDRVLNAEDEKIRKTEAEARLIEQIRLAKAAGLDIDAILRRGK